MARRASSAMTWTLSREGLEYMGWLEGGMGAEPAGKALEERKTARSSRRLEHSMRQSRLT